MFGSRITPSSLASDDRTAQSDIISIARFCLRQQQGTWDAAVWKSFRFSPKDYDYFERLLSEKAGLLDFVQNQLRFFHYVFRWVDLLTMAGLTTTLTDHSLRSGCR